MLDDVSMICRASTDRDRKTVTARVELEGFSFYTITLSDYGKDFQQALDRGRISSDLFAGFSRKGGLPKFLSGFLCQIFDSTSGELLTDPSVECIQAVRQLCFLFAKIDLPCSEQRNRKAIEGYVQCEYDIHARDDRIAKSDDLRRLNADCRLAFAMLFGDVVGRLQSSLRRAEYGSFLPKHGPGATADRLVGNQKFYQSAWSSRLEAIFPAGEFVIPNWRHWRDLERFDVIEPGGELPVKVTLVPKTLKSPRIIAIEPTCMQYTQQAIASALIEGFEQDNYLSKLVTIHDQEPNQLMARIGSTDGRLSTIDLSEASDRISNQLVTDWLAPWPDFQEAVDACRSRSADVPGYGVLTLAKFASMGSALTFPIETMVFLSVVVNRLRRANSHLTWNQVKNLALHVVRAYGDDLIVPTSIAHQVIADLESLGFKVNRNKTFTGGLFRESCGKEYYGGADVSTVKCRRVFPTRPDDVQEVIAMVSFRNQLYYAGYWTTCQWLDERLRKVLRGRFPLVEDTSTGLGRWSVCFEPMAEDIHPDLQLALVKAWVVSAPIPVNSVDGVPALLKCLLGQELNPDERHLERSGRPKCLSIKLRKVPVS